MSTIDIHLPEQLQGYLNDQIARRGYKDASEFVKDLLEADRHRQIRQETEASLLETVDGPFAEWSDQDIDEIRITGQRMLQKRQGK